MKTFNVFTLIIIVLLFSCQTVNKASFKQANNPISLKTFIPEDNGYKLFWEDNFDGDKLDPSKWQIRGTGARRMGYNDASTIEVKDGNLLLKFEIRNDSVLACAIGTENTFMSKFGYYECRAQLQKGIGPWAAFWMQSPKISKGADPAIYGAEIDIFEYFKELGKNTITHCVHWAYGPNMQSTPQMRSRLEGLSEGFHTFGLEWTPEEYSFFIDGLKYHECKKGVSKIEQYMILSMELPYHLNLKLECNPDTFIVDYVKVYQKEYK